MRQAVLAIAFMMAGGVGSALAAPVLNTCLPTPSTNLVLNGSFECINLSAMPQHWTTTGAANHIYATSHGIPVDPFTPPAGSPELPGAWAMQLTTTTGASATISQAINVVAGTNYSIGYDIFLANAGNPGTFTTTLTLGGVTIAGLTVPSASLTAGTWAEKIVMFQSTTTGTETLAITFTPSGPSSKSAVVDRVFVTNVPEPSSILLLAGGLAVLARMRRRKA
jgi:hypothetical protein